MNTKNRITIELDGGYKLEARALSPFDLLSVGEKPDEADEVKMTEFGLRLNRVILTRCCGKLTMGEKRWRLVDKPFDEVAMGEMSIDDLPAESVIRICTAVAAMNSDVTEEVKDAGFRKAESGDSD